MKKFEEIQFKCNLTRGIEALKFSRIQRQKRRDLPEDCTPSSWIKNSVFRRRLASCSWAERLDKMLSISSTKMMAGARSRAIANKERTSFSPWPMNCEVKELALIAKKVALLSAAQALAIKVLPLPGGPYINSPFGGCRSPGKGWSISILIISNAYKV